MMEQFRLIDFDSDGIISTEELLEVLNVVDPAAAWDRTKVQGFMNQMDINQDGVVGVEDFLEWTTANCEDSEVTFFTPHQKEILEDHIDNLRRGIMSIPHMSRLSYEHSLAEGFRPGPQSVALGPIGCLALRSDGKVATSFGPITSVCIHVVPEPELPDDMSYTSVAAGESHCVLLRSDGKAVAFGVNEYNQCNVRKSPRGVSYVAAACGQFHTVLVRSDGQAVAFGLNRDGQCDIPDLPKGLNYVGCAAGEGLTLLLRSDGQVISLGDFHWRLHSDGIDELPRGVIFVHAAVGEYHILLLRSDGQVAAYGRSQDCKVPELPNGVVYIAVAAASNYSVFLRSDGTAVSAGSCHGYGAQCSIPRPPDDVSYISIAARGYPRSTALLRTDGEIIILGVSCVFPTLPEGVYYGLSDSTASSLVLELHKRVLEDGGFEVTCRTMAGIEVTSMQMHPTDTFGRLKEELLKRLRVPVWRLCLLLPGVGPLDETPEACFLDAVFSI